MASSFARSAQPKLRMKARLIDLAVLIGGKQRLTIELDGDFRSLWDELHEKECEVAIKRYSEKRSLSANAYAWVLIDKIAAKRRMSKVEVYRNAIRDIGGVSNIVSVKKIAAEDLKNTWCNQGIGWQVDELDCKTPGWTLFILYKGSSEYDTEQMSALIDSLIQDANALGIETKSEEEINSLLEEYSNA